MTVSTIAALATGIDRTLSNKVATSVRNLISADRSRAQSDFANIATASVLQNQVSSLRVASQNIAAASSLLDTADNGAAQISRALDRLRDLASKAGASNLNTTQRTALNSEFQSLRQEINRIASTTSFGGQALLDGSLATGGENVGGTSLTLTIGGLSDADLFKGTELNILSSANAEDALSSIATAQKTVTATRNDLAALGQGFDYAAATIEAAVQNQDASRSQLSDEDFADIGNGSAQARFQAATTASLFAQTNRLPSSILSLLNE